MGVTAYDAEGKEVGDLYELMTLSDEHNLVVNSKVKKVKIGKRTVEWGEDARNIISAKMNSILQSMHGNYTPQTAVLLEADLMTVPLLAFRRWMQPTIYAYYEGMSSGQNPRYHAYSDEYRIGRAATFKRYVLDRIKADSMEWWASMALKKDEEARIRWAQRIKDLKLHSNKAFMLEEDEANLKEMSAAVSVSAAVTAAVFFLGMLVDRERKRKKMYSGKNTNKHKLNSLSFLYYIAYRARMEQFFYINPADAISILRSPAPMMSVMDGLMDMSWAIIRPWRWGETYKGGALNGKNKVTYKIIRNIPVSTQIYRMTHMDDQLRALGIGN
ncbi:hypothetical protein AGMMS50239_38950 [Bacteroidia bacterium]|nr:hypothetical protein AGMMS50239_38950 [Bacteroidia bacterium]